MILILLAIVATKILIFVFNFNLFFFLKVKSRNRHLLLASKITQILILRLTFNEVENDPYICGYSRY